MSKSLGNSEDAVDAAGRMGADVLRLVYASLDYTSDITLGQTIFNAVSESYRKIRNTCRFVLGNLADFDPARDAVEFNDLLEFDRFILARTEKLKTEVRRAYEAFEFQTAFQVMLNFVVVDLSSLYIDVARDRLYCAAEKSRERRSAQTALFQCPRRAAADARAADSVHRRRSLRVSAGQAARERASPTMHPANPSWRNEELEARWERLLEVRDEALKLLEAMRKAGTIGAPLEAAVSLSADGGSDSGLAETLKRYREELKDLFIVSDVAILGDAEAAEVRRQANGREDFALDGNGTFARAAANPAITLLGRHAAGAKCPRCWKYFDDGVDSELDARCRAVVGA